MKTIDFSYFIEKYNSGEMSEAEKCWFDKELAGNDILRQEVILRKQTDTIIKGHDLMALRNKLSRIESTRMVQTPVSKGKNLSVAKYAAVISIILLIGSITLLYNKKPSLEKLISQNNVIYEPSTTSRSLKTSPTDDFTQGVDYYKINDFKNAAFYFKRVIDNNPKDMEATLLNGISNYQESQFSDAKLSLGKVIDDNKNLYIDQAQYYLALCYLNTDETEKAIQLLYIIRNEDKYYAKKAKKILRSLK